MRLRLRLVLVGALLAAGCTPTLAAPPPPRPTPATQPTVATTAPTTTTTVTVETTRVIGCETDFCLAYHIRPDATWSSGAPVTASDFAHTAEVGAAAGLPGYDLIESVEVLDPETAVVTLERPYGAWQGLFDRLYPADGDLADLGVLETTGPFTFTDWQPGEFVTLERNTSWWAEFDPLAGGLPGDVREVTLVFVSEPAEMVDGLRNGEVDVIAVRPDPEIVTALGELEGVDTSVAPGPFWEHITFHHDDPVLSRPWAREAISLAIDREAVLDETVRLVEPSADLLANTVWMIGTPQYERHFDDGHDPAAAERLLGENGCEPGDDGIQVCGGTRMSFIWASTNDDLARRATFDLVRDDLGAIGIELIGEFVSPSEFVTREFLFGSPDVWQLINFSWRARPDPREANATYYCDDAGSLNVARYCSEGVESLIRSTETITDPAERAAVYNEADRLYLEDRAVIPLYQKPMLMAWIDELEGPEPNYTISSDLWNIGSWSGKESIVVALAEEPGAIDPLSRADDSANEVLGALLYGAFGMSPSQERIPVLVESVEVIRGGG